MFGAALVGLAFGDVAPARAEDVGAEAKEAATRAASYFADELSVKGGYVWAYDPDLKVRRGKGGSVAAGDGMVQPPGTPAVGAAFLRLNEATADPRWLAAAGEAAHALVASQLLSGGWSLFFPTDPEKRSEWCYRTVENAKAACAAIKSKNMKNRSQLDDNITQGALSFLIWYDAAVNGSDGAVREAVTTALDALVAGTYPNGACPMRLPAPAHDEATDTFIGASFGEDWSRKWVEPDGSKPYYVLNDHLQRDCIRALLSASRRFGETRYLDAARHAAQFLLRAQLPAPQTGWAQAYDWTLTPVWGRKFEPPAVASNETAGVISVLLEVYSQAGDERFLEAAERGARWLESVRLENGLWSRFYELQTDRPLYIDADGKPSYEAQGLHEGYTFTGDFNIPEILADVAAARANKTRKAALAWWPNAAARLSDEAAIDAAATLIDTQEESGRWISDGWIQSRTFVDATFTLAKVIESASAGSK